ncbi:DUF3999 family protein [Maribacter chungangensis]|uniref:DUF3999 family protein n=1 Tax=Maribacter chungangensis TaxID=1069117 RepID=A0ABW3B5H7_9FLAO
MKKTTFIIVLFFCPVALIAQLRDYNTQVPLDQPTDTWHTLTLPKSVFSKIKDDFSDLRIYGTTETDTVEVPYVLRSSAPTGSEEIRDFKLINSTSNSSGYFYTYDVPVDEPINKIELSFENQNFDWKITLEGSQDQNQWFTIVEDYRILSIKNEHTDYTFTDLTFPDTKYTYYRIQIKTKDTPKLKSASILLNNTVPATYVDYSTNNISTSEKGKTSQIQVDLKDRLPVSYLKVNAADDYDFYRGVSVSYIIDSVKTDKGWKYSYRNLFTGTLTSLEKRGFSFPNTLLNKLRISIVNDDNPPLEITSVDVKGYSFELVGRFTQPANYYLAYGNTNAYPPKYDLQQTGFELPKNVTALQLGKPIKIEKPTVLEQAPLFENKWWLWGIMGLIILVLGGATLKMMKENG